MFQRERIVPNLKRGSICFGFTFFDGEEFVQRAMGPLDPGTAEGFATRKDAADVEGITQRAGQRIKSDDGV